MACVLGGQLIRRNQYKSVSSVLSLFTMGIEQSSYQQTGSPTAANTGQKSTGAINRTVTARQDSADGTNGSGRSSPHPSLCSSETDVPYVSYTVNKPIGGMFPFL